MARPKSNNPTDRELAILQILWEQGECTVKEVHTILNEQQKLGYTSVLKIMQIMAEKGLVERDTSSFSHLYTAAQSQESTQQLMVGDLVERLFKGSAMELVASALSNQKASKEELEEIQKLIDSAKNSSKEAS